MRLLKNSLILFCCTFSMYAQARKEYPVEPAPNYDEGSRNSVSIRTGSQSLGETSQQYFASTYTFTEKSDSFLGIEYLHHFDSTHAIGADVFRSIHNYTATGVRGELEIRSALFTYKAHTGRRWLHPFLNLAIGVSTAKMSHNTDIFVGPTYGIGAGLYMPFSKHVGVTVEYRYLDGTLYSADVDYDLDSSNTQMIGALNFIF